MSGGWNLQEVIHASSQVLYGFGSLQICPALCDLTACNAPNDDSRELHLTSAWIGSSPHVPHYDFVTLGDNVFYRHSQVRRLLQSVSYILSCACWPRRCTGRHIRSMINEVAGEIHIGDLQILAVYELLKMISDKGFHLLKGHPRS